jgi:hypothetical protein
MRTVDADTATTTALTLSFLNATNLELQTIASKAWSGAVLTGNARKHTISLEASSLQGLQGLGAMSVMCTWAAGSATLSQGRCISKKPQMATGSCCCSRSAAPATSLRGLVRRSNVQAAPVERRQQQWGRE